MKLHRLAITAIGPFPGEHTVDFDALGVSGLFLLTGPTGSGKSTLLDAIEFALYGTASGAMKERLPSGHAAPGTVPRVELVFSNHRGVYRIERSPEFRRPKARGEGVTTEKPRATLVRLTSPEDLDAVGEPITAHIQDVGATVQDIVGLTRDQFTQTVILPQGKFARFLTASPEERRGVLQDVFGTRIYEAAEEALRARAAGVRAAAEQASQDVAAEWHALAALAEAAAERAGFAAGDPAPEEMAAVSESLLGAAISEEGSAWTSARAARTAATHAQEVLSAGHQLAAKLDKRESAARRLAELEGAADSVASDATRVALAERAAACADAVARAEEAAARAEEAGRVLVAALERCRDLGIALPSEAAPAAIRDALVRAERTAEALTDALGTERELGTARADAEQVAATIAGTNAERSRVSEHLASLPDRRRGILARRAELEKTAAELAPAAAAQAEARARADAAQALVGAAAEAARTAAQKEEAARAAHAAQRQVQTLHAEWIASIAGEVAEELSGGEPCPVCGSTHHPQPAVRPEGAPSRADVADARLAAERADAIAHTASEKASSAAARMQALQEQLGGRRPEKAAAELEAADLRVARAREAAGEITDLNRALEVADQEAETVRLSLDQLTADLAGLQSRAAVLEAAVAAAARVVDAARGPHPTVAAAAHQAEAHVTALRAADVASGELGVAARLRQETAAALAGALGRLGFADAAAVRESSLEDEAVDVLTQRVAAHHEALVAVRATLADPELAGLGARPDLTALAEAAEAAESSAVAAEQRAGSAHEIAERIRVSRGHLLRALAVREEAAAASAPVIAMADAASGRNPRSTSLSSYVLLRRFEEVLAAANRRLAVMSEDRYQLVRSDQREAGQRARKLGLAVDVVDHELEATRSPHTLSGGETFYTSLALALGLTDTVTDEAGGIELGTLFVDEGFGSLDPDALENVMDVLKGLSSGGRAVGIVSHVAELRGRIPEQVVVKRLAGGGSTLAVEA